MNEEILGCYNLEYKSTTIKLFLRGGKETRTIDIITFLPYILLLIS